MIFAGAKSVIVFLLNQDGYCHQYVTCNKHYTFVKGPNFTFDGTTLAVSNVLRGGGWKRYGGVRHEFVDGGVSGGE